MPASPSPPSARVLWALLAAVALLWFVNLDARRLLHPDEGRYAEIAREMAATGDWVTPRVNELKYFEKPPFQYWVTAAAYRAFGVNEWTARLWPALAGFLAVVSIGCAGYALGGAALGAYAGLALAATFMHAAISQIVTLDAGLSSFLALGFAGLVIAQRPETAAGARRTWMWVAWAALAGATLSKGLIGVVLPGGALVVYTALTRDFALWRRLHLASGLALYLALTAPWFVAVARANDEFLRFFFVHEHFERFLTTGHERRRRVALLRAVARRRHPAVADRAGVRRRARVARRHAQCARLLVAALRAGLGRVRLPVLQRVGIEAAVVHPADVSAAGARRRLAADANSKRGLCSA